MVIRICEIEWEVLKEEQKEFFFNTTKGKETNGEGGIIGEKLFKAKIRGHGEPGSWPDKGGRW